MMWQAIQYVTGGFTLCAFIVPVIAYVYKGNVQEQRRRIEAALPEARAVLVAKTLEFFDINTTNLDPKEQYNLAIKQINARIERFRVMASVVVILAILSAGVTLYALSRETAKNAGSKDFGKIPDQKLQENNLSTQDEGQRLAEIAPKIKRILVTDRDSGDRNGVAGSCPTGERVDFYAVGNKIFYYSCAHDCFATKDTVMLSDLDFEKMTVQTLPYDATWAWVEIPCLATKGKCVHDEYGTIGSATKGCQRPMDQQDWLDTLRLTSRTVNAGTVKDLMETIH